MSWLVAVMKRKHHRAENFLKGLGRPLPVPLPVAEAGKPIFVETVQSVLDLLFDVTREAQHGAGQFASLSMLYWTVDELNVAFYLSERKYTTQAYGHIRTVTLPPRQSRSVFPRAATGDVVGWRRQKEDP